MRNVILRSLVVAVCLLVSFAIPASGGERPGMLVNPFVGTDGHGHTFPGATTPFGMVQLSPDTRVEGWDACGGYHYSDTTIRGFSHTHLSGTGVADYGDILITPLPARFLDGRSVIADSDVALPFHHRDESASPGYYRVDFRRNGIVAELTATPRTGFHRYTFPPEDTAVVVVNLHHGLGPDRVLDSWLEVTSQQSVGVYRQSEGWAKDQRIFGALWFSRPIASVRPVLGDTICTATGRLAGTNVKVILTFAPSSDPLVVKVALSPAGIDGAKRNFAAEAEEPEFDEARAAAEAAWDNALGRIEVEGGTPDQQVTFYTALYHAMIAPNLFSDVDGRYRGMDGSVRTARGFDMYTVFSLWDTFRAEHPLLCIIDQKRTVDFIRSILAKQEESGVLPVWELAGNETWCMIGYHAVPVIVDAYMKDIRDFDAQKAFEAMKKSAMLDHFGLDAYREYGYVPGDLEGESVSKTLEYAYDDWCIAMMARRLGKEDDAREYEKRALSFVNLFDPGTKFFRPKVNGMWVSPFDPLAVTMHFTEANAWQYRFFAPHATDVLIDLMGGRNAFVDRLDSLFSLPSRMTGRVQSDISGMIGQYAQGNEPSHHMAYLFGVAGKPWNTQRLVRTIMDSLYSPRPDGLCGNDDCGQMSAWYVFNAMGIYPVTPGEPWYEFGSPLFSSTTIHLENGRKFVIRADDASKMKPYVLEAKLNGKQTSSLSLTHRELMWGGELVLRMSDAPGPLSDLGVFRVPDPFSPTADVVVVPYAGADQSIFRDSLVVSLACPTVGATIMYTLNGERPDRSSLKYSGPFTISATTTVRAIGLKDGMDPSPVMKSKFIRHIPVGTVALVNAYAPQYTGGGDQAILDGQVGGTDFRLGAWQGYEGVDLDAVIDLGTIREVGEISLGCLQDNNSWIFFPHFAEFTFSTDGKDFSSPVRIDNAVSPSDMTLSRREFGKEFAGREARYVRVVAKNIGTCPPGHKGGDGKAWLFVDELTIR